MAFSHLTGRKHQLRRHMAHLRHPIIGDCRLALSYPVTGIPLVIDARWNDSWRGLFPAYKRVEFAGPSGQDNAFHQAQ